MWSAPVVGGTTEIAFDDGGNQVRALIGQVPAKMRDYRPRVVFTLHRIDNIQATKVRVHVRVGTQVKPLPGESEVRLAVRVNQGEWYWRSLESFKDGQDRWLEFEIPVSAWRLGLNEVEATSTVANQKDSDEENLYLLGSGKGPYYTRSSMRMFTDRYSPAARTNYGIRLFVETKNDDAGTTASVDLRIENKTVPFDKPTQIHLTTRDAEGRTTTPGKVEWTASQGYVDPFGLFWPGRNGSATITVKADGVSAKLELNVRTVIPTGMAEPTSEKRLTPRVPDGHLDLNGRWAFRLDPTNVGEKENWHERNDAELWGDIHVPGCWQAQGYGTEYHGIGWYRRTLEIPAAWQGREVWLNFDGVATRARVWVNGKFVGEHLGNWVPFVFRITEYLRPGQANVLTVRVEEDTRHWSVGFPAVVGGLGQHNSHFGGIWQSVHAYATDRFHLDDVFVLPRLAGRKVEIEATVSGGGADGKLLCLIVDPDGKEVGRHEVLLKDCVSAEQRWDSSQKVQFAIPIAEPQEWVPDAPRLYTARITLVEAGKSSDNRDLRFGMRDMSREGHKVFLNGRPLFVRGILHWGYYPDLFSIDPSEEQIRREFADLRACGFNLVKVCLFVFPRRFYEIADETGMLVWQEYPMWGSVPKAGDNARNEAITREYMEWFRFDRNHPSVILRDLTCEADRPNPELFDPLYKTAKQMTGQGLICDNSAYLDQVNSDWYDIHAYQDLDEYLNFLVKMTADLRSKPEILPFLAGEDLDCDTYRDTQAIREKFIVDGPLPWWLNNTNFLRQEQFEVSLNKRYGDDATKRMIRAQNLHSLATRKGYIEAFRGYPELAGYVICGLRDITATRPGFYDDLLRPKWSPAQWKPFNDDQVLILKSPRRSFCFRADEPVQVQLLFSNYGDALQSQPVHWRLLDGPDELAVGTVSVGAARGEIVQVFERGIELPERIRAIRSPRTCRLEAHLGEDPGPTRNVWNIWIFPAAKEEDKPVAGDVLVTETLDGPVRDKLLSGATVVYLASAMQEDGLPRRKAPFWREMTIWLPDGHPALGEFPHDGFVDWQFLDLTSRLPFDTQLFREDIEPIVWGTNARDPGLMFADYIFEAAVGKGKLLACCLNVTGAENVAGAYLRQALIRYAASPAFRPVNTSGGTIIKTLLSDGGK